MISRRRSRACATAAKKRCAAAAASPTIAARWRQRSRSPEGLIRTFNALLMIARAELGQARENMTEFDAADIVRDVAELYEPLADDKGLGA